MSFDVTTFVAAPKLTGLAALKRSELVAIASHYDLEVNSGMRKADVRQLVRDYLLDENVVSDEEVYEEGESVIELKRLELQEREREREAQVRLKELEIREREIAVQIKAKELELATTTVRSSSSASEQFDVTRHIRFVPPFQETEPDKYFLHFEKIATSLSWPRRVWTLLLQSSLVGKAREAYSALSVDQSSEYDIVKTAVLKAYELVPEAYRQKFRANKKSGAQTYVEFAQEKQTLFDRWCGSKEINGNFEKLRQLILLEEFKDCLPTDIKTYLDEQKVDNLHQAATRADDYALTHRGSFSRPNTRNLEAMNKSGEMKHDHGSGVNPHDKSNSRQSDNSRVPSGPTCYYCKRKGHVKTECPALAKKTRQNAIVAPPKQKDVDWNQAVMGQDKVPDVYEPFVSQGKVSLVGSGEENTVTILRDTGASQSLVLESVLPFSDQSDTGTNVLLQGVELGTISVPLHKVFLRCSLKTGPVVIGVRSSLPVRGITVLLGNDLAGGRVVANPKVSDKPQMLSDDGGTTKHLSELFPACAVTRAMQRARSSPNTQPGQNEPEDSTQSSTLEEEQLDLTDTFLGHLHGDSPTSSNHTAEQQVNEMNVHSALSRQDLIEEQAGDSEVQSLSCYAVSEKEAAVIPVCYFWKQGVLMRKWRPPEVPASEEWKVVYQIVLPHKYRYDVLSLAHETPMAGHLGVSKTYRKVLNHFYWPGVHKDVKSFIRVCHTCQMAGKPNQKPSVAPLKPIPVLGEPFSHVLIDCVGPLPKSKRGNQYILTIMCAATRFPEAVPLRTIKTPNIVKALIKFFTLVGLPHSVQSDQGSNFMSSLFQEVMFQLGIKQRKSTAYHPQSQGALERFHQTLKSMLRAYCLQENKEWDEGLPLLLFAVRESVQASLGFSPFELVFGHTPRGPLKLLKEVWLTDDSSDALLTHISDVRDRLKRANDMAQEKLRDTQKRMKTWYDRKARTRTFHPGDKVLALLPIHGNPLQAKYCGPYTVAKKTSDVDYVINTPGRRKSKRLCHVNMLKPYHSKADMTTCRSIANVASVSDHPPNDSATLSDPAEKSMKLYNSDVLLNLDKKLNHLPEEERTVIKQLVEEFVGLFPDVPGKTIAACHDVEVGNAHPIKQHPYRINPIKLAAMREEVQYMLQNGIIEPSQSHWSSPCILVPKPDGSYRFCTDFRRVNSVTKSDSYPIPRVDDCIDQIGHARYITKLDLLKGYWQVPLTERAKEISAFVTPDGLYQYTVMPFGMKNAPATYQRMINNVLSGVQGCGAYIDDLVLYSNSWVQHLQQLRSLLCRLQDAKLTVNLGKSEFCQARVVFLGYVVGQGQVAPVVAKVEAIHQYPVPRDKRDIMRFLGMAGYYRKFCHNFATIAAPLTELLQKKQKFMWTQNCQAAFEKIKAVLLMAPVLRAPDFSKLFKLFVDASDIGVGGVLLQEDKDGIDHPVCYFSRKLDSHQRNYSTCEKETLALLLSLQHFDIYLRPTVAPVQVYTDHNPLVFISKMKNHNQRLLRWSLALQEYDLEIRHVKGRDNVIADALSRAI